MKPQQFPPFPYTEGDEKRLAQAVASFSAARDLCSVAEAERLLETYRRQMSGLHGEFLRALRNRQHAHRFQLPATGRVATVSMRLALAQYRKARRLAIEARARLESLQDARAMLRHIMGEDLL